MSAEDDFTQEELQKAEQDMLAMAQEAGAQSEEDLPPEDTGEEDLPPEDEDEFIDDDEPPAEDDPEDDPNFLNTEEHERLAREDGWVSEEEFKADPKNDGKEWVPAAEFNRRKPLIQKISRQSKTVKEMQKRMARMEKMLAGQYKERTTGEIDSLREERRQAILQGDPDRVDELDDQIRQMESAGDPFESDDYQEEENTPPETTIDESTTQWLDKNQWFVRNDQMKERALAIEAELLKGDMADADNAEILEEVAARIRKEFPAKFGRRQRSNTGVNGGRRPRTTSGRSYSDLPEEARQECDFFVKKGHTTREDFVKEYFNA